MARFLLASPTALMIGGPIAGGILRLNWFGLSGWRWIFILEGLPAVAMGVVTWFFMTDRPEKAAWLKPAEREWVTTELAAERQKKAALGKVTVGQALRNGVVIQLAMITLLANIGIQGYFLWLPATIQRVSGFAPRLSAITSGLPFVAAVASVLFCSWSSDRTAERTLHTSIPLLLASCLFPITTIPNLSFGWVLFWLCASGAAIYGFGPSFWVLPTVTLGESAAAAAVGFINCFSAMGGFVGPSLVGSILTARYPYSVAVGILSICFLGAAALAFGLRKRVQVIEHAGDL
jgi:ACS family tartrate transporter-like MFS transporter